MTILTLYLSTALVFLLLDGIVLTTVIAPIFRNALGDHMLETPRIGPAAGFYLFYLAGLLWLVSWPALTHAAPLQALLNGAILGALAYGTYEITNLATLRRWRWNMVVADGLWGTVLTGVSAWAGVQITLWLA